MVSFHSPLQKSGLEQKVPNKVWVRNSSLSTALVEKNDMIPSSYNKGALSIPLMYKYIYVESGPSKSYILFYISICTKEKCTNLFYTET